MFHPAIENFTDDFIIGGDFNFLELIWEDGYPYYSTTNSPIKARTFIDILHNLSAYQLIEQPTWFCQSQQSTVFDLMFVNRNDTIHKVNYLPPVRKSNHLAIEITTYRCPMKSKCKR